MRAVAKWLVVCVVAMLAACAGLAPLGVKFEAGELEACAQTQQCVVMTPAQLRRFYWLAYQAGRTYEQGKQRGEESEEGPAPWQTPEYHQRSL